MRQAASNFLLSVLILFAEERPSFGVADEHVGSPGRVTSDAEISPVKAPCVFPVHVLGAKR